MEMLTRMNEKLNLGWKMTNMSCQVCNGVTMAEMKAQIQTLYCPKCNKEFPISEEIEEDILQKSPDKSFQDLEESGQHGDDEDKYYEEVIKNSNVFKKSQNSFEEYENMEKQYEKRSQNSNEISKLIGQKLLQGWAMLEECCLDCNVPLMKSKAGDKICCGCKKNYAKIQKPVENIKPKVEQKKKIEQSEKKVEQKLNSNQLPMQKMKNETPNTSKIDLITQIEMNSLRFLSDKVQIAIQNNDLLSLEKLLALVHQIKKSELDH